jgi:hypothetical protein
MVAERRDLMVETYSSYCGTGAAAMVFVCTGNACGAACGGADLAQAVSPSTATVRQGAIQTGSLLKMKSSNAKDAAEAFALLYLQFDKHLLALLSPEQGILFR